MFYIEEESFIALMAYATPLHTRDPWGMQKRLARYPVVRQWDSGEQIGASSGQWEEQARLIDVAGELYLERQEVYHGECYGSKPPAFYKLPFFNPFDQVNSPAQQEYRRQGGPA